MLTCRKIYHDVGSTYYEENIFCLSSMGLVNELKAFESRCGKSAKRLTQLKFCLSVRLGKSLGSVSHVYRLGGNCEDR